MSRSSLLLRSVAMGAGTVDFTVVGVSGSVVSELGVLMPLAGGAVAAVEVTGVL